MAGSKRPVLELIVLGLQPRDARPDDGSGFSSPTWTWPASEDGAERPLSGLLARPYRSSPEGRTHETSCREDDPDRQALAVLEMEPPAEIDAVTRALGDWILDGGTRESFGDWIESRRAEGFSRLLCFDPVHLKAETDHAITLGPRFLSLSEDETDGLLGDLNAWFYADDMRVERIGKQLYLLARVSEDGVGPANVALKRAGAPLACLLNRNAGVFLDERHSEAPLRQWLTEVQMWLYPRSLNDDRAAQGQPILNSFWPHGMIGLDQPPRDEGSEQALILSDSSAVLARHDAVVFAGVSSAAAGEAIEAGRPVRVVLTEAAWCRLEGDLGGFQHELSRIDDWLAELTTRAPGSSVVLRDGRGGEWRPEGFLMRLWRRLASHWRGRS